VIKFVSDLREVNGFLWLLRFPPLIKLTATYVNAILLKAAFNNITLTQAMQENISKFSLLYIGNNSDDMKQLKMYPNLFTCNNSNVSEEIRYDQRVLDINFVKTNPLYTFLPNLTSIAQVVQRRRWNVKV
jgi:hypothetical protein